MSTYVISGPGKDNRQDYKTKPMQLNSFDDLQKFLHLHLNTLGHVIKNGVRKHFLRPTWCYSSLDTITNSLAVGIILCFFFTIGNYVTMMLTPDMSKGVFLDIFYKTKKNKRNK